MPETLTTPGGEELVVLAKADYEALVARQADDEAIFAAMKTGTIPSVPDEVAQRLLGGEHPVRVWREVKGLSQTDLAARAGLSASAVSKIEAGDQRGTVDHYTALAKVLGLRLDDLV